MGLNFPLNAGNKVEYQIGQNISNENLYRLLNATSKEDVVTPVALQAFGDYQNAQTGIGHYIRKYTTSVAAYTTMVGAPVAAVVGGTYWLLKDYIAEPATLFNDLGQLAYNNKPMIGAGNPVFGAVAEYTTPVSALTVITSIGLVDAAFYRTVGIAPVVSIAKWSVLMMSSALAFAAKQAGDMVARSYDTKENENIKTRQDAQKAIIDQLTHTYDDMADGFLKQTELAIDSPRKMHEFVCDAELMKKQFPLIKSLLRKLDLGPSSVDQIMSRLVTVMDTVKHVACELRSADGKDADKYNTELLSILTVKEFTSNAVPKEVKKHLDIAANHTLGSMHTIKSYVAAGTNGFFNAALFTVGFSAITNLGAYFAGMDSTCYSSPSLSNCNVQAGVAGIAMIPGIAYGVNVATNVQNAFIKERKVADARKIEHIDAALIKLVETYNGIAEYLKQQYEYAQHNVIDRQQLVWDAECISEKIPMIKQEIADTAVIENSDVVTEELETILAEILKN